MQYCNRSVCLSLSVCPSVCGSLISRTLWPILFKFCTNTINGLGTYPIKNEDCRPKGGGVVKKHQFRPIKIREIFLKIFWKPNHIFGISIKFWTKLRIWFDEFWTFIFFEILPFFLENRSKSYLLIIRYLNRDMLASATLLIRRVYMLVFHNK